MKSSVNPAVISSNGTMYQVALPTAPSVLHGTGYRVRIPGGISNLATFRRWAHSPRFPVFGRIDLLGNVLWLDLSMEEMYTHNLVKTEIYRVLIPIIHEEKLGYFLSDRMRFTYPGARASVEPDGAFVSFEAMRSGRVRKHRGRRGIMELVGQPDLVIEVVSESSEDKDYENLPTYYAEAGVAEFWRVDARKTLRFEILRLDRGGFLPAVRTRGWQRSDVFGRSFRFTAGTDPIGQRSYKLEVRP